MSSIVELEQVIKEAMNRLKANSCTFYVQDPWWPEDLRLLFMPGVRIQEPMHGFLMPRVSKTRITEGDEIEIIKGEDWKISDSGLSITLQDLISSKPVFGNFAVRENVKSRIRLIFRDAEANPKASLFLNYNSEIELSHLEGELKKLMNTIDAYLGNVVTQLEQKNPLPIKRLLRILDTTKQLTAIGGSQSDPEQILEFYFRQLLQCILEAYDIDENNGFGTIHLFDTQKEALNLQTCFPEGLAVPKILSCKNGEGTVSWVALKSRPVLITNLRSSEFQKQKVYKQVLENIQCEVALPMLVSDKVVGVLNIESTIADSFEPEDVRVLWYAANHAAVAFHLGQQVKEYNTLANRITELLQTCKNTVSKQSENENDHADKSLNDLATQLANWTGADMADIWGYDRHNDRFWGAGASSRQINMSANPRQRGDGFSRYVIDYECAVWINDIKNLSTFSAYFWDKGNTWRNATDCPKTVSPVLESMEVGAEIGVPIISPDSIIGVAWLKFKQALRNEPSNELMNQIEGLVASVALVMEFLQKYDESMRSSQKAFEKRLSEYSKMLFPDRELEIPGLRLYVRCEPHGGAIGGDFYGFHLWQGKKRVAIILGDGRSHGIEGALQMLPLYTSFRILCSQTTSTHYVLEKMSEVAHDVNVAGTAAYFIIDLPENGGAEWTVSASVAGEAPPLMIFDSDGNKSDFPPKKDDVIQSQLGLVEVPPPLGEALTTCQVNNVIVAVTDGILDAGVSDQNGRKFGSLGVTNAVIGVLNSNPSASPGSIAQAIFENARCHGTIHDDATVIVVKMEPALVSSS